VLAGVHVAKVAVLLRLLEQRPLTLGLVGLAPVVAVRDRVLVGRLARVGCGRQVRNWRGHVGVCCCCCCCCCCLFSGGFLAGGGGVVVVCFAVWWGLFVGGVVLRVGSVFVGVGLVEGRELGIVLCGVDDCLGFLARSHHVQCKHLFPIHAPSDLEIKTLVLGICIFFFGYLSNT